MYKISASIEAQHKAAEHYSGNSESSIHCQDKTSKMLQYNHPVQLKCSNENMALVLHIFLYNSIIYFFNQQLRVLIGPLVSTTRLKGCHLSLWGLGCLGFALAEHLLHLLLDVLHPASPLLAHFIFIVLCYSCVAHEGNEAHVEEVGDV